MVVTTLCNGEPPTTTDAAGSTEQASAAGGGSWAEKPIVNYTNPTRSPLIDIRIVFRSGAAADGSRPGLANLTASLIARSGSEDLEYSAIQEALFPMAASFSAQVDKEMTTFIGRVHRDHADKYWEIVSGQLLNPGWREDDFTRVRTNVINQIRTDLRANNDEELGKEILYEQVYDDRSYGHLNLGHVSYLKKAGIDDARRHWSSHYDAGNVWVGIAGGFSEAFANKVLDDLATGLPPSPQRAAVPGESVFPLDGHRVLIVEKDTRATALSFGFEIPVNRSHQDFAALWLARSWLGEHRSSNSHLFQRMREIRGMNYGDYAYVEYFPRGMFQFHPDAGLCRKQQIFQVWVRPVPPEQGVFALRIARFELDKMIANGLSSEQFESTRSFLTKYLAVLVKSQDRQLGYAMDSRWYGMDDFVETMRARLAALSLEDVNQAIRRHLSYDSLHIVFIAKDAEDLKARLVSGAPSPMEYSSEKPEEILREDMEIAVYPLGITANQVRIINVAQVFENR